MVSNEEYENALKNYDNVMIMHSASLRFANALDQDELHRCKLIALWEALQAWKPNGGNKFTAFLYQRVCWECLKNINYNNKKKNINLDYIDQEVLPDTPVSEVLEVLPEDLRNIVEKRYIYNMTFREIGEEYGYSYEAIRKKLKKAKESLSKMCVQNLSK